MAKKDTTYKQCTLLRPTNTGHDETTSWLPSKFAKVGKVIDLKDQDGSWSRNWKVQSVGPHETATPPNWRELIKAHRRQTGDSLPK